MKVTARILAIFCIGMMLGGSAAFAQGTSPGLPLASLPKLKTLDDARRNNLLALLKQQKNHGTCKASIYECLALGDPDPTAVRLANFAAFLLSRGVPAQGLVKFFAIRAKFASGVERREFKDETAPSYGSPKAPILLTEFAEFKCAMCGNVRLGLKQLVDDSNGAVRLSFKHYPIVGHEGTLLASSAAVAAQRQGKFWEMAELLYRNMDKKEEPQILELASGLGLDMERFRADLADPAVAALVRADKIEGVNAKVDATPTLFINGKRYELRMDEPHLKDTINEEAERLGIAPPYKDWVY